MTAPIPENEVARVQALHQYAVLNTAPEPAYDQLAELAASICGTPIAAVSLIDSDRQWIKANVGLNFSETARDVAMGMASGPIGVRSF